MQLDVFIEGETIDLCVPTLEFAQKSDWYKWFNDTHTTRYLEHGVFPNTPEKQIEFFQNAQKNRLLLIIVNKNSKAIGSTSLMNINYKTRSAALGIVVGNLAEKTQIRTLESIARITEHGFLKLGLQRIYAGQHINHIPYSHRMSLLGYRIEGIERGGFVKCIEIADVIKIACTYEDYQRIIEYRGEYWDSQESMLARIDIIQQQETMHKRLQTFFKENVQYYDRIFNL